MTPSGTVFVGFPRVTSEPGLKVAKMVDGKPVAFPDEGWNGWKAGTDPSHAFVRFNSMRIGPDGRVWIVDVGSPAINEKIVEGGPKILAFDPDSGRLERSYTLTEKVLFPPASSTTSGSTATLPTSPMPGSPGSLCLT